MAVKKFPVEYTHIMMFARSVGDDNPIYHDEEYARKTEVGGIIAPPTFAQASAQFDPDFFLRPKVGKPWLGSGKTPTGIAPKPKTEGEKKEGGKHYVDLAISTRNQKGQEVIAGNATARIDP